MEEITPEVTVGESAIEMERAIFAEQMKYLEEAMKPVEQADMSKVIDYSSIRKENLIKYQTQKTFDYMDSMLKAFIVLPDSIRLNQEIILDLQEQLKNMELTEEEQMYRMNGISSTIKQIMTTKEDIENRLEKAKTHNSMLLMIEKVIEGAII